MTDEIKKEEVVKKPKVVVKAVVKEVKPLTLHERMLNFQKEVGAIKKDSENPYFKSKFFDINALLAEVKPILNKYGIVLSQPLGFEVTRITLKTVLTDGKETIESTTVLPEQTDPQKVGSAITYFRRYALQSLLALEAEDDDAELASPKTKTVVRKLTDDNGVPF